MEALWRRIREVEESHQVELSRELDAGFAATIFAWAEGKPLEDVLGESGLTPGDFVRTTKQILDLLRQIRGGRAAGGGGDRDRGRRRAQPERRRLHGGLGGGRGAALVPLRPSASPKDARA